ncbi:hypothetical protein ACLB2K_074898 [Fragaria x ananassa]
MKNTKATNNERMAQQEQEEERPDEKPCYILQLPDHITREIFLLIPFKTLMCCRFVCKSWHRSLSNPSFTKTLVSLAHTCHLLRDVDTNKKFFLADVRSVGSPENMVLKLSDHADALHNKVDSYEFNSGFIGSSNGFLCLFLRNWETEAHQINISNPITGEYIALPIFKSFENFPHHFGFGFSPHPEEVAETSVRETVQVSDVILQEWTASFAGWGENYENEVVSDSNMLANSMQ